MKHTEVDGQDMVLVPAKRWYTTERNASWSRTYMIQRNVIAALGVYEAIAIMTCRMPTISALAWKMREDQKLRAVLFVLWGWLSFHIFTEGPTD